MDSASGRMGVKLKATGDSKRSAAARNAPWLERWRRGAQKKRVKAPALWAPCVRFQRASPRCCCTRRPHRDCGATSRTLRSIWRMRIAAAFCGSRKWATRARGAHSSPRAAAWRRKQRQRAASDGGRQLRLAARSAPSEGGGLGRRRRRKASQPVLCMQPMKACVPSVCLSQPACQWLNEGGFCGLWLPVCYTHGDWNARLWLAAYEAEENT